MKGKEIQISFLITHYNRPKDLEKCVEAIKNIGLDSYEIVVSDDCSSSINIGLIKEIKVDKLILSSNNQGLASNLNRGIKCCSGKYIIYCQEDFELSPEIKNIISECIEVIELKKVNMVRFRSIYNFPELNNLSENINLIPKFSFKNFLVNSFQYSDNPFITTKSFFDTYGYYLGSTSGDYGETEFAIRIFKSSAKIGIVKNQQYVSCVSDSFSVIDRISSNKIFLKKSSFKKNLRAIRLHFEMLFYNKDKRGLMTYKNHRIKD